MPSPSTPSADSLTVAVCRVLAMTPSGVSVKAQWPVWAVNRTGSLVCL